MTLVTPPGGVPAKPMEQMTDIYGVACDVQLVRTFCNGRAMGAGYELRAPSTWFVYDRESAKAKWHMHCGPYSTFEQARDWINGIREDRRRVEIVTCTRCGGSGSLPDMTCCPTCGGGGLEQFNYPTRLEALEAVIADVAENWRVCGVPTPTPDWQETVRLAMDALESDATVEMRRDAWDALRDLLGSSDPPGA